MTAQTDDKKKQDLHYHTVNVFSMCRNEFVSQISLVEGHLVTLY